MQLRVYITCAIKDGYTAEDWLDLRDRAGAMVAEREPGTVVYNWWLGEDGTVVHEDGFVDEAAFGAHMANMGETGMLDEWMGMLEIQSVHALGDISDATREAMVPFGAAHFSRVHER